MASQSQYELGGVPASTTTTHYTNGEPPTSHSAMTSSASDLSYESNLTTPMPRTVGNPYDDTSSYSNDTASERSSGELQRVDTNSSIFSNGSVSEKRAKEWRDAFDVEGDEELVDTHGAALAKDILVHGRIYISTKSVAFKSNILGFKTKVHFPLTNIVGVRPKMTALVIPNAIEITQDDGTTTMFSTLPSRDATLEILMTVWRQQAPERHSAFISRDRSSSVSSFSSGSPVISTDVAPVNGETTGGTTPVPAGRDRSGSAVTAPPPIGGGGAPPTAPASVAIKGGGGSSGGSQDLSKHPATTADTPDFPELALDTRFPTTPEKLFNLMFNNEAFLKSIWESEGFTDTATGARGSEIGLTPWSGTRRQFEYIKPLTASVGPSSCKCEFSDEIIHQDPETWYGVVTTTQTPGVPSGKSFKVMTKTVITWAGGPHGGARVKATSNVEWSGRSMLKSVINSQSIAGQKTYNAQLSKAVRSYIKTHPAEFAIPGQAPSADDDDDDEQDIQQTSTTKVKKTGDGSVEATQTVKTGAGGGLMDQVMDWAMEDIVRAGLLALVLALGLYNLISLFRGGSHPHPLSPPHYHVPAAAPATGGGAPFDSAEVRGAMERLHKLEKEWHGVRSAFLNLAGGGGAADMLRTADVLSAGGAAPVVPAIAREGGGRAH